MQKRVKKIINLSNKNTGIYEGLEKLGIKTCYVKFYQFNEMEFK
jgi:hypothetical protein